MADSVQCPGCGEQYRVPDGSLGERAKCKSCGERFTLEVSADETRGSGAEARAKRAGSAG
jgi:predicted Zn finger-like uncharacterized protein